MWAGCRDAGLRGDFLHEGDGVMQEVSRRHGVELAMPTAAVRLDLAWAGFLAVLDLEGLRAGWVLRPRWRCR